MRRAILVALALGLAWPARADEPVDLKACPGPDGKVPEGGCRVPFDGALVDKAYAAQLAEKRKAAEAEALRLGLALQAAQAAQGQAEQRAQDAEAKAAGRPSWGALLGTGGVALAVGLVAGVALALAK